MDGRDFLVARCRYGVIHSVALITRSPARRSIFHSPSNSNHHQHKSLQVNSLQHDFLECNHQAQSNCGRFAAGLLAAGINNGVT